MDMTSYYTLWAGMYILCTGLGFIPEPAGFGKFCLVILSIGFFVPPACLLRYAGKRGYRQHIRIVRNFAIASLVLTVMMLLVNFLSFMASEAVGTMLYILLLVVSTPMICSQYWVISLFGWACLMIWAQKLLQKK